MLGEQAQWPRFTQEKGGRFLHLQYSSKEPLALPSLSSFPSTGVEVSGVLVKSLHFSCSKFQ